MSRGRVIGFAALTAAVALAAASRGADPQKSGGNPPYVLGPVQQVAVLDEFAANTAGAWKARFGDNVASDVRTGYELPGVAASLLRLYVGRKDLQDREPGHNWLTLSRDGLPAGAIPENIDGFRFLLGSESETQWWISVDLTARNGETYSHVLADHSFPAGRILEYSVPLEAFRSKSDAALTPALARSLRGVTFTVSSPGTALLLDRIAVYRREKLRSWLDFTTSHPENNLFQRTDPVTIVFTQGGTPPKRAAGFRYEIRDFFNRATARGQVRFTGAKRYSLAATPKISGYYEVRAFFTDARGKDLEKRSCIRAEGSVPDGLGTFSVLPSTLKENAARSRKLGENAFFGLHGDFLNLADYMGLTWRFEYTGWNFLEPTKPDRSSGMAAWARDRMREPPAPDYRLHILPFRGNFRSETPEWARSLSNRPPPYKNWDDYLAMVRDSARVEKHRYPHMKHRIYGGAWEINLNMPPYLSQQPEYHPDEIAELFRRFRETVKAEDPSALVIGPCPSVINPDWFENVFKGGVLKYLDGIETHGYNESSFTPEENDFPAKIARLNALTKKYKGRALPIYCTEAGQPGILGSEVVYRSQAQRMTRAAIILKGEGVKVFLPFYGIDYDRAGYWGFLFNLDIDSPAGPWFTKRTSPKPMVNAIAVCAQILEGAAPRGRIRTPDKNAWAYVFQKGGTKIAAAWSVGKAGTASLPIGKAKSAKVIDLMGRATRASVKNGRVRLTLDGSPRYVVFSPGR
jgi:hypothetical protein